MSWVCVAHFQNTDEYSEHYFEDIAWVKVQGDRTWVIAAANADRLEPEVLFYWVRENSEERHGAHHYTVDNLFGRFEDPDGVYEDMIETMKADPEHWDLDDFLVPHLTKEIL